MKLAMQRRQTSQVDTGQGAPGLTVVGSPARILSWPSGQQQHEEAGPRESVVAELRTKRFSGRDVEQDRYTATVDVGGRSLAAILAALAETCSSVEEFGRSIGTDDHLILNIQVRL